MLTRIKKRLSVSLLCAFILPFILLICGTADIYAGNQAEFTFGISDFIWIFALIGLGVCAVIFAILMVIPDRAYPAVVGFLSGIALMMIVQSMFFNRGLHSLPTEEDPGSVSVPLLIIGSIIWIAVIGGCIFAAYKIKKFEWMKLAAIFLAIFIYSMSAVGIVVDVVTMASAGEPDHSDERVKGIHYLSSEGIDKLAPDSNIIVFLLDRFDVWYYNHLIQLDSDYFAPLTGFTYYKDNISAYTATYPSVCHMITGAKQDFSVTASQYFSKAYDESTFLYDLSENDYAIKLYTGSYYAYRDDTVMPEYIQNAAVADHYEIVDRTALLGQMFTLSVYRYAPTGLKLLFPGKWFNFRTVTEVDGECESVYELDDVAFYHTVTDGLEIDRTGHKNSYIFYHLNGCHAPVYMDADCNPVEEGTSGESVKGCFKIIFAYIEQLKKLGLYENSTIVITGDHSSGHSGEEDNDNPPVNGTALFFKPAGRSEEPIESSRAQVCDDYLIPSLVKSAGINTQNDYGKGYNDIPEGEITERRLVRFRDNDDGQKECYYYTVKGQCKNKANWELEKIVKLDSFYK